MVRLPPACNSNPEQALDPFSDLCRSELAREKPLGTACIQDVIIIVNDLREQEPGVPLAPTSFIPGQAVSAMAETR